MYCSESPSDLNAAASFCIGNVISSPPSSHDTSPVQSFFSTVGISGRLLRHFVRLLTTREICGNQLAIYATLLGIILQSQDLMFLAQACSLRVVQALSWAFQRQSAYNFHPTHQRTNIVTVDNTLHQLTLCMGYISSPRFAMFAHPILLDREFTRLLNPESSADLPHPFESFHNSYGDRNTLAVITDVGKLLIAVVESQNENNEAFLSRSKCVHPLLRLRD